MRYECAEPGFEAAWIEIRETGWTRKAINQLRALDESDEWFALLRSHVTGLHLPAVEGDAVSDVADLTPDALDRLDLVLFNWFVSALIEALRDITQLGNAPWRRLSRQSETATATNSQDAQ